MKLNTKSWQGALVGVGLLVAVASANDDESKPGIVKPGDQFHGKSYNELVSEWTNWLFTEPPATNPAFDPDGRFCDRNQRGKVWFLASTFEGVVNRTCEVPAGKAIFVSLGGGSVSFAPEFPTEGDPCLDMATPLEQVRCDANDDVQVAPNISIEVMLDGVPVEDLFAYRVQSQPGGFTFRSRSVPAPRCRLPSRRSLSRSGRWIFPPIEAAEAGHTYPQPECDQPRPVKNGCELHPDSSTTSMSS